MVHVTVTCAHSNVAPEHPTPDPSACLNRYTVVWKSFLSGTSDYTTACRTCRSIVVVVERLPSWKNYGTGHHTQHMDEFVFTSTIEKYIFREKRPSVCCMSEFFVNNLRRTFFHFETIWNAFFDASGWLWFCLSRIFRCAVLKCASTTACFTYDWRRDTVSTGKRL